MSKTKNGRIKSLIARNKAASKNSKTVEAERPRMRTSANHTVSTKHKDTGEITKTLTTIEITVNTHGRSERRGREIMRLEEALKGASKKVRMKKFSHKKDRKTEDKPKKGKGKK